VTAYEQGLWVTWVHHVGAHRLGLEGGFAGQNAAGTAGSSSGGSAGAPAGQGGSSGAAGAGGAAGGASGAGGGGGSGAPGTCTHDLCLLSYPLVSGCDPCVTTVCDLYAPCCTMQWDSSCVIIAVAHCPGVTC
jgi:hypothetical protein